MAAALLDVLKLWAPKGYVQGSIGLTADLKSVRQALQRPLQILGVRGSGLKIQLSTRIQVVLVWNSLAVKKHVELDMLSRDGLTFGPSPVALRLGSCPRHIAWYATPSSGHLTPTLNAEDDAPWSSSYNPRPASPTSLNAQTHPGSPKTLNLTLTEDR